MELLQPSQGQQLAWARRQADLLDGRALGDDYRGGVLDRGRGGSGPLVGVWAGVAGGAAQGAGGWKEGGMVIAEAVGVARCEGIRAFATA